ncbi:hypothetical protein CBS101457_002187 [Exobasidium rhododendri]|nr:hypothetical protein CBS101457_002187 [Exobasidium rhododendri]
MASMRDTVDDATFFGAPQSRGRYMSSVTIPEDMTLSFVISRLRKSGPYYWERAELSDCTIVVPISPCIIESMQRRRSQGGQGLKNPNISQSRRQSAPQHRRVLKKRKGRQQTFSSTDGDKNSSDEREWGSEQTTTDASTSSCLSQDKAPPPSPPMKRRRHSLRSQSAPVESLMHSASTKASFLSSSSSSFSTSYSSTSKDSLFLDSTMRAKMIFNVHSDFLLQCGLFARLFSVSDFPDLSRTARLFFRSQKKKKSTVAGQQVRIIATTPQTIVHLPLPDPISFSYILHYLYHGSMQPLLEAMDSSNLQWQGVIANVDFLDLDASIKRRLGKWWREHACRSKAEGVNGGVE